MLLSGSRLGPYEILARLGVGCLIPTPIPAGGSLFLAEGLK
jgi:hypothetical protein